MPEGGRRCRVEVGIRHEAILVRMKIAPVSMATTNCAVLDGDGLLDLLVGRRVQ
jgi:hypothetical protein